MAVTTMPQKRYKYMIQDGVTNTELTTDPKGWDGHDIGFERSDDFGLNIQNVVPLSYSGTARNILRAAYKSKGVFANTKINIQKRQNDWTYAPFYIYKLDYSTYKDNLHFIEISGIEDGLAKKFDTYKDTEYEIDLPATSDKIFIDYTGASYVEKNTIQCKYGEIKERSGIGTDHYVLGGSRSVRSYNDKIAFTDADGLPYQTMTFRALQSYSGLAVNMFLNVTIEADGAFLTGTTNSGKLRFIQHDANFNNATLMREYFPTSTSSPGNNRIDTFTSVTTETINILQGQLYSVFYLAENKNYKDVSVTEGGGCRLETRNLVSSAYQNQKLEAFTYEWLLAELLKKIDPTAFFECTVEYPNVKEILSATPCIYNMGSSTGTGKIKTTLKDVLESFNKLKCIAIDITGNTMTVTNRRVMYPTLTSMGTITVNNIMVEHDPKHQYNKVMVGADTDDREDDDPLIYPFICEKQFNVEGTVVENELNLVNNFMLDPYTIDKYIREMLGEAQNKDECEFVVFACIEVIGGFTISKISTWEKTAVANSVATAIATTQIFNTIAPSILDFRAETSSINADTSSFIVEVINHTTNVSLFTYTDEGSLVDTPINVFIPYSGSFYIKLRQFSLNEIPSTSITSIAKIKGIVSNDITINYNNYLGIYKNHTKPITNFVGDSNTIYNIPLTPKRILNRWAEYLAISLVGSPSKLLKFGTTTIQNSAIDSICDYEVDIIYENTDLELADIVPMFLPATISCDTKNQIDATNSGGIYPKYDPYTFVDEKTNESYEGWINSVTFPVTKNESKQLMLQAKII